MGRDDLPTMGAGCANHTWPGGASDRATSRPSLTSTARFSTAVTSAPRYFIIEQDGVAVGFIQNYRIADHPPWLGEFDRPDAAGIDHLIGDASRCGKGFGSAAIRSFATFTFERMPDVSAIVVAPQQANVASWRALEKAGFARIYVGSIESDDPSDAEPAFVYELRRDQSSLP